MNAIARFFVAAMMAVLLSTVPETARADHDGSGGFIGGGTIRPRAICGSWGCYSYNRGLTRRTRGFRRFLGALSWAANNPWSFYGYGGWGGWGGYYPYYYGGYYGPYWPGDYRNAYAGLFGNYVFPPVY